MPSTRRKQAKAASSQSASQSTLSFNSKAARVTKPSVPDPSSLTKKPTSKLSEPAETQVVEATTTPEPQPEVVEVTIRESPAKPKSKSRRAASAKNEREVAAEKITDAQLKKYWKAEEDARLAPRVHQSSVSLHEKILRHFDISSQYGPCIGIPRLARWKRANGLGLEPPVEVLAVLLREESQKTSQGCGKIAYLDELSGGGGRGLVVE